VSDSSEGSGGGPVGRLGRDPVEGDPVYVPSDLFSDPVMVRDVQMVSRPWRAKFSVELVGEGNDKHVEQLQSFLQTKLEALLHAPGLRVRIDWIVVEGDPIVRGNGRVG
jgi:hypothetical protein